MAETEKGFPLLSRENLFIFLSMLLLISAAWLYIFYLNSTRSMESMGSMEGMSAPQMKPFGLADFLGAFLMWSSMMAAMMIPSAMPMILVFAAVYKKRQSQKKEFVPAWIFTSGYILVWVLFSAAAASLQVLFHNFAIISDGMKLVSHFVSGIVLIIAGTYQFTPLKNTCLKNCQSPLNFIMGGWRNGKKGAFTMGLKHGAYCLGCCWALMLLLFVAGIMNILWIALIAMFVFFEKILGKEKLVSYISGTALILFGIYMIFPYVLSSRG